MGLHFFATIGSLLFFLSDARKREVVFFALLGREFLQILGQIVSLRAKTRSNTNLVVSRHTVLKEKKAHFRWTCVPQKRG